MFLFPPAKKEKTNSCNGTILIVILWTLAILTVFAIALGQRASLEIKLVEYQRDELKAIELAKAAIERAVLEKKNEQIMDVDILSESWANNESMFHDFVLGEGTFSVSYSLDGITLYGIEDEESKININEITVAAEQILVQLLENCGIDNAGALASSILIWNGKKQSPEEEDYYQDLDLPYPCKKEEVKSLAELLLVRGITPEILYGKDEDGNGEISEDEQGIARYLTVFGSGKVNINTASEKVLSALIGGTFSQLDPNEAAVLVEKIADYRKGLDGTMGTADDYWFSINAGTSDLAANDSFFNFYGATPAEFDILKSLENNAKLSVSSNIFTIYAKAKVRKVKQLITATIDMNAPTRKYIFWHQN